MYLTPDDELEFEYKRVSYGTSTGIIEQEQEFSIFGFEKIVDAIKNRRNFINISPYYGNPSSDEFYVIFEKTH